MGTRGRVPRLQLCDTNELLMHGGGRYYSELPVFKNGIFLGLECRGERAYLNVGERGHLFECRGEKAYLNVGERGLT